MRLAATATMRDRQPPDCKELTCYEPEYYLCIWQGSCLPEFCDMAACPHEFCCCDSYHICLFLCPH